MLLNTGALLMLQLTIRFSFRVEFIIATPGVILLGWTFLSVTQCFDMEVTHYFCSVRCDVFILLAARDVGVKTCIVLNFSAVNPPLTAWMKFKPLPLA